MTLLRDFLTELAKFLLLSSIQVMNLSTFSFVNRCGGWHYWGTFWQLAKFLLLSFARAAACKLILLFWYWSIQNKNIRIIFQAASGGVRDGGGQSLSQPDQARLLWLRRQLVTGVDRDKVGQGQARWDLDRHQFGNYRYLISHKMCPNSIFVSIEGWAKLGATRKWGQLVPFLSFW